MIKRLLPALIAILMVSEAISQPKPDYRPLRSKGEVPHRVVNSSSLNYEGDLVNVDRSQDRSNRKSQEKFYLESNFAIDELLRSGKVLFNDPVSEYCNKVADELLKDNTVLRNELEFYVVKSPSVNAFTSNNGIIFINIGLIAQLENEAQLAFILSHEIVHYQKKHALKGYVEKQEIFKGKGEYRKTSLEEKLLSRSKYSKQQESEADLEGLELYLKSKYSLDVLQDVFDVLRYAHTPFDEVEFKTSFLETKYLKFPADYILKETSAIKASDDEEDSLSTHPSATQRQEAILKAIKSKPKQGRLNYLVSEKEFLEIQRICRYELTNLYLKEKKFEDALYNTYLLMQQDSTSKYLRKSVGEALYGLCKFAAADNLDEVHTAYGKVQGSKQRLVYLFDIAREKEIRAIATIHLWRLKNEFPEDKELAAWAVDATREFAKKYTSKNFFEIKMDSVSLSPVKLDLVDQWPKDDKIEKLKVNAKHPSAVKSSDEKKGAYLKYALIDLLMDKEFVTLYDSLLKVNKSGKDISEEVADGEDDKVFTLNKVVKRIGMVNPFFFRMTWKGKVAGRQELEERQTHLSKTAKEMAAKAGMEQVMFDNKNLETRSADFFNDAATLTEFMQNQFEHKDMGYITHLNEDILALRQKYNLRYLCMPVVMSLKKQKFIMNGFLPLGLLINPFIPLGIYKLFVPKYATYYYFMVVDLETGKSTTKTLETRFKSREDVLRSNLYYFFFNLKHNEPIK